MWAEYNHTSYPLVEVNLKGVIRNNEEFENFTKQWLDLYERKTDFVFIFDTRDVGWVSPKYAFKMATFISELKKRDKQYLKRSSIIVNSTWVRALLALTFAIQSPVCPIYFHRDPGEIDFEFLMYEATKESPGLVPDKT